MTDGNGYFSVHQRNPGHWDVSDGKERAFAIRGEPGMVIVRDERSDEQKYGKFPRASLNFPSIQAAIGYIAFQFMAEPGHP